MSQHGHTDSDVESGPHESPNIPDQVRQDGPDRPADSEALFSAYLYKTLDEDTEMVKRWKDTADGLLVFIGLFSTVVATFIAVSVPSIQRNPQDTSSFYLAHIYQQLSSQPNASQPSIPSSLINPIEPFVPPTSAAWACGLWSLSLVITLTCALLAISLQQWARRFLHLAYYHRNPYERACLRSFYKSGVGELNTLLNIEWVPMLLHISLFLFFAGISVYFSGVHRTIFKVVTAWIEVCVGLYAILTVLPIIYKSTPFSSPFSSFFYSSLAGLRQFPLIFLSHCRVPTAVQLLWVKAAEKYALKLELESSTDNRSLLWESLKREWKDDSHHEKFFEGFSHFCRSESGGKSEVTTKFIKPNKDKLSKTLIWFIDRTFRSTLIQADLKDRRMIIFTEIMGTDRSIPILDRSLVFDRVLFGEWDKFVEYIGFGHLMKNWADDPNKLTVWSFYAQCLATLATSTIRKPERDKRWIQMAQIPSTSVRYNEDNEDRHSILLAHAIYIVRMSVQTYSGSKERDWDQILKASQKTLRAACKFAIRSTSRDLQHEFCDLWNKLVTMARTDQLLHHTVVSLNMLKNVRKLYIALHNTDQTALNSADDWDDILDNPNFYPECTEVDHLSSLSFPDLQVSKDRHSMLLAHAIHIVRVSVQTYSGSKESDLNQILNASQKSLRAACKLEIRSTSPDLQHEFCDLWNKLVTMAQTDEVLRHRVVSLNMLKNIRKLYIALHGTDQTAFNATDDGDHILDNSFFYPKCTEDDHHPSSRFPDLQVSKVPASQTPSVAHTPRDMPMRLELFPEPFPPSSLLPSNPVSSRSSMSSFPDPNLYLQDLQVLEDRHGKLLAHVIYIVRMSVQTYSESKESDLNQILNASQKSLQAACKFDILDTLPHLQHEFCDLWNKLVTMAQTDEVLRHRVVSLNMLKNIRKLYIALHGTDHTVFNATDDGEDILDNPLFYPKCTLVSHSPSSWLPDLQVSKVPVSQTPPVAHTPSDMPMPLESFPEPLPPSSLVPSNPVSSPSFRDPNRNLLAPN